MVNGGFAYGYLFTSQHHNIQKVFNEFLLQNQPARILEIGTFHGGLTLMLRDILDSIGLENSIIRTYDINNQEFLKPLVIDRKVEVITKNLFNDDYSDFKNEQTKNELISFIDQKGLTIVLCDGGCKKCEFNLISPMLKNKDIIMAHDYSPDVIYFESNMKNKIWDWLEIEDKDIQQAILDNNLYYYNQESMQAVAWLCMMRS